MVVPVLTRKSGYLVLAADLERLRRLHRPRRPHRPVPPRNRWGIIHLPRRHIANKNLSGLLCRMMTAPTTYRNVRYRLLPGDRVTGKRLMGLRGACRPTRNSVKEAREVLYSHACGRERSNRRRSSRLAMPAMPCGTASRGRRNTPAASSGTHSGSRPMHENPSSKVAAATRSGRTGSRRLPSRFRPTCASGMTSWRYRRWIGCRYVGGAAIRIPMARP